MVSASPAQAPVPRFQPPVLEDKSTDLFDRVQQVRKVRWVDYPTATAATEWLNGLFDCPETHRPPCGLIYSDTNNGKTTICRKFARAKNEAAEADKGTRVPVLMVQAPAIPDVGGLYAAMLRALDAPMLATARAERKHDQVLRLLPKAGVEMIIIDEIHHLLAGKVDQRSIFMNSLKGLSNELEIPVLASGTQDALRAFQTDQQLGNRFTPFHLPRWSIDGSYALFLARLCESMELQKPSNFHSKQLVTRFHTMTEGLTGETTRLMSAAAEVAIKAGREMIDTALLDEVRWTAPGERRRGGWLA